MARTRLKFKDHKMRNAIDHLVIGASSLEQGVQYVRETLGVEIPFGGVHKTMGTHNHLMRLGGEVFLEVIAVNLQGEAALQPRWYGLDDPYVQAQIARQPALLTWVVNTSNLPALLRSVDMDFGVSTAVSRGALSWLFGLPRDGRLLAAGMLPYLIEWKTDAHPSHKMAELGCTLESLEINHPNPDWLSGQLKSVAADGLVAVADAGHLSRPALRARINTPSGIKTLCSVNP